MLSDWIYHKSRPHLNMNSSKQLFRESLEKYCIEFEAQKTFDDLKTDKNH